MKSKYLFLIPQISTKLMKYDFCNHFCLKLQPPNLITRKILPQPQHIPYLTGCQPPRHTTSIRSPIIQQLARPFQIQQPRNLQQPRELMPNTPRTSRIQITDNGSQLVLQLKSSQLVETALGSVR